MIRVLRWLQMILGTIVAIGVLWLGLTNGTGITSDALSGNPNGDMVTIQNYDGEGQSLDISYLVPPNRVLVTYPGATELLIVLGLEHHIVATLKPYGAEPPELATTYEVLPQLESPFVPSKEEVLAVQPDLIIGWNHHFLPSALGDIRNWYKRGIETYIVPATVRKGRPTVEGTVFPFIDDVGRIFGVSERTEAYKKSLVNRIERVQQQASNRGTTPSVLVLQSYGNSTYTIYGEKYIIHDIVHKAGATTLAPEGMMSVGPERILGYNPDYIVLVVTNDSPDMDAFTKKGKEILKNDLKLEHMRAIEQGHIIPVPFSAVNNGNGRVVDALEIIAKGLE